MKPFLALIVFTCFSLTASSAQTRTNSPYRDSFNKGNWQVGIRDGRVGGNLIGKRNTLQLHSGYYLAKQLAVGLSGTWGREGFRNYAFHDITAGPYLRYQFTATRLSPFIDLSYQFGKRLAGEGVYVYEPGHTINSNQPWSEPWRYALPAGRNKLPFSVGTFRKPVRVHWSTSVWAYVSAG